MSKTKRASIFAAVADAFKSTAFSEKAANAADLAYNKNNGTPEGHVPFTIAENPQMVAMNLAGVYAADSAAHMLAALSFKTVTEEFYLETLRTIAEGKLDKVGMNLTNLAANLSANLAWRAGQPFRDISTNPFARITRPVNVPWASLPPTEQMKDMVQVKLGAQLLLAHIEAHTTTTENAAEPTAA